TCRPPAPRRIFCASLSDAYRASSPDRRGLSAPNIHKRPFNPQTLPAPNSGSKPEPTRCVQTQAKSKKITQKRHPRRRNRQSAALSGFAKRKDTLKYREYLIRKKAGEKGGTGYRNARIRDGLRRPLTADEMNGAADLAD